MPGSTEIAAVEKHAGGQQESTEYKIKSFHQRSLINFIIFCLIAAPLSFHVEWFSSLSRNQPDWLVEALQSGPLYFYSVILCVEGYMRLGQCPDLLKDWRVWVLRKSLLLPITIFIFRYSFTPYYTPYYESTTKIPDSEIWFQSTTGLLAFFIVTTVHYNTIKYNSRRRNIT